MEESAVIRGRSRKYVDIEKEPIQYLDIRAHKLYQDKCGVGWMFMENKLLKFAEGLGINDFKSSPICISDTIKRNKKFGINLHDKENDMTDEEREIVISAWSKYFHANIMELDKTPECVYNADQNGLYYQNLPNDV